MVLRANHETNVIHDNDNLQPQCDAEILNDMMQLLQDQDLAYYIRNGYDLCNHCWPIKTVPARKR